MTAPLRPGLPATLPFLVLLALAAAPLAGFDGGFAFTLMARIAILATAATGLAFLVGAAGLPSMGHAALLGIGAYAVAALDSAGVVEGPVVFPAAIAAGALFALLTGAVSLRTGGVYFIMITLAFGQMLFFTAASVSTLGGDDGYTLAARTEWFGTRAFADRRVFHYACLLVLAGTWAGFATLSASRFGRVLRAAKENPRRVEALGWMPYGFRLLAFVLAGASGGLAGALWANAEEFVSPAAMGWTRSGELLFIVILGGAGRLGGAIAGAAAVVLLEEALSHALPFWRLAWGPMLVLAVLFLPNGLTGGLTSGLSLRRRKPANG